ncbi:MAG: glycosyltransferase [Pseudomonadota bacterium]
MRTPFQPLNALLRQGRLDEMAVLAHQIGHAKPYADQVLSLRAVAAFSTRRPDLGLALAWTAAKRLPRDGNLQALIAHGFEACGEAETALSHLESAVDLDPTNIALALSLLRLAARTAPERAPAFLKALLPRLDAAEAAPLLALLPKLALTAVGACRAHAHGISGWVAGAPERLALVVETDGARAPLPLVPAEKGLSRFALDWPEGARRVDVCWADTGKPLPGGAALSPPTPPLQPEPMPKAPAGTVAVIVPVHSGLEATRACIDALHAGLGSRPYRIVAIDDASPDPALSAYLRTEAEANRLHLIPSQTNRGFTAAANAGLAATPGCDAVLLNADTIVPPGWLDRLARALESSPDIASATPLTNNGQHLSHPRPNEDNPMPSSERHQALDTAAAKVNAGQAVEIPVGAGFCLMLRRACLDEIGPLDQTRFGRGYGEETDFCLRATAKGWRHVAATDVFVAHHGSLSFGAEKHALVRTNMAEIRASHPAYDARMARFNVNDALAPARARLERATLSTTAETVLAVARLPDSPLPEGAQVLALDPLPGEAGTRVALTGTAPDAPANLRYRLPEDLCRLRRDVARLGVVRLALYRLDLPLALLKALDALRLPKTLHIEDPFMIAALSRRAANTPETRLALRLGAEADRAVVATQATAKLVAPLVRNTVVAQAPAVRLPQTPLGRAGHIAVVGGSTLASARTLLLRLARLAAAEEIGLRLFLFEDLPEAGALERTGCAHTLAPVTPAEAPALARALGCRLALAFADPLDPSARAVDRAAATCPRVLALGGVAAAERTAAVSGVCLRPDTPPEAVLDTLMRRTR